MSDELKELIEWIPVDDERKPEICERVLVISTRTPEDVDITAYLGEPNGFSDQYSPDPITHWARVKGPKV